MRFILMTFLFSSVSFAVESYSPAPQEIVEVLSRLTHKRDSMVVSKIPSFWSRVSFHSLENKADSRLSDMIVIADLGKKAAGISFEGLLSPTVYKAIQNYETDCLDITYQDSEYRRRGMVIHLKEKDGKLSANLYQSEVISITSMDYYLNNLCKGWKTEGDLPEHITVKAIEFNFENN